MAAGATLAVKYAGGSLRQRCICIDKHRRSRRRLGTRGAGFNRDQENARGSGGGQRDDSPELDFVLNLEFHDRWRRQESISTNALTRVICSSVGGSSAWTVCSSETMGTPFFLKYSRSMLCTTLP